MNVSENSLKGLLEQHRKIAVYGLSPDPQKPSHYVPLYMREHGWEVVGVYPKIHSSNHFSIVSKLSEIPPQERKFLNVFRSSEKIPELVDEILQLGGTEVLWLQLGIFHPDAEKRAEAAGIQVVSNRCLIIEHRKFFSP